LFPDAEIKRCAFHWGQAVMRKVANLGLKTSYNEKKGDHIFVVGPDGLMEHKPLLDTPCCVVEPGVGQIVDQQL
jgi:hypothetical protein